MVAVDACTQKEQLKQEYRNYGCTPGECTFAVTSTRWIDTGVISYLPPTTPCGFNTSSCPADSCSGLTFLNWTYSSCQRYCNGAGSCGKCDSCSLESKECTASGCCEPTCSVSTGCGVNRNNRNCQSFCLGDIRHFSGICENNCSCSYTTEDCSIGEGWRNTSYKRSNPCADNLCQICEETKQEYVDCSCTPIGCSCQKTQTRWFITERRNVTCPPGKVCLEGRCVDRKSVV
jgi:hypothetical protein